MIAGFATTTGTEEYFNRRSVLKSALRSCPWFTTSCIGHGTYLGDGGTADSSSYQEAISFSLRRGINFLDTAIVYRDQKSERDIRSVLETLIVEENRLQREEIIIATKAGFLPADGDAGLSAEEYLQRLLFGPGVIQPEDVTDLILSGERILHCLNPDFLEFCLEQSRQNLGLETIDIFYLQNPELAMLSMGPEDFYAHLHRAFERLEKMVVDGRIRHYGLATWQAFQLPPGSPGYISLERCQVEALSASGTGKSSFHFIQLPLNAQMKEVVELPVQPVKKRLFPAIDAARELQIEVTVNIPLLQGKVLTPGCCAPQRLREITSNQEIFSTMVGMRQRIHVSENIDLLDED